MKINIYLRGGVMWVETEGISNPDGCTGIDTECNVNLQALGLEKLLRDVVALSKENQERLDISIVDLAPD